MTPHSAHPGRPATAWCLAMVMAAASLAFAGAAPAQPPSPDEGPGSVDAAAVPGEGEYAERAARLLVAAGAAGDELGTAQAQHALAHHMMVLSLWPQAAIHAELAREAARKSGDVRERLATDITLGRILPYLERAAEASEILLRSLELARTLGDTEQEQLALLGLSGAYLHARQLEAAEQFTRDGLTLARSTGHGENQVRFLNNLGLIAWTAGDVETAARHVREATELQVDDLPPNVRKTLVIASITLAGARDAADAERAREIIDESRRNGSRFLEGFATEHLGRILCASGDTDEALARFADAEPLFAQTEAVADLRRLNEHWAQCLAGIGRHEEAYARQVEATKMLDTAQERRQTTSLQVLDAAFRTEHHLTELAQRASEEQLLTTRLAEHRARIAWLFAAGVLLLGIISALAMRNRRLSEQQQAAADLQQARIDLLARTSHEIRSPAQGIIGLLEGNLADPLDRRDNRALVAALGGARMIGRLADDCLDLALLEQGRLQLRPDQVCHLPGFVDRVATLGEATSASGRTEVAVRIADGVPERIHVDEERLAQVLLNLIANAAHYARGGIIPLCVDLGRDGGTLEFAVTDKGPGLGDHPELLFDPYSRDDHLARNPRGTGLGLAISARILRAMGGTIRASNQPGGGARFVVSLPLRIATAPTVPAAPAAGATTGRPVVPGTTVGLRALVIDDDPFARLGLSTLLSSLGHAVLEAGSGEQLEATLDAFDPHLVLIDQHLAQGTGTALAQRLRDHDHGRPAARTVAIVSGSPRSDAHRDAAIDDWLIKPVGRQDLQTLIETRVGVGFSG